MILVVTHGQLAFTFVFWDNDQESLKSVCPPHPYIQNNCLVVALCFFKGEKSPKTPQQSLLPLSMLCTSTLAAVSASKLKPVVVVWGFCQEILKLIDLLFFSCIYSSPLMFFQLCGCRMIIVCFPPPYRAQIQWNHNKTFGVVPCCCCSAVDLGYEIQAFASLPGQSSVKM